jgi:hypothetical protein
VDFLGHLRTPAAIERRLPPSRDEVIEFLGFLRNFRLLEPVQIDFAKSLDRHRQDHRRLSFPALCSVL